MTPSDPRIATRLDAFDWGELEASLWDRGFATTRPLLAARECEELVRLYSDSARFRKRVDMERHQFGIGEYQYFARPLPRSVQELRTHLYRHLAPIANRFQASLKRSLRFPPRLRGFLEQCRTAGQAHPTPLLLRYQTDGYNCLHRDLYGELWFPLQATIVLSRPGTDFEGGEFLLVENRPRAQSRGTSISLERGALIVFPTAERPVRSAHGFRRVSLRHGLSPLHRGSRYALGIIFHDAA